MDRQVDLDIMDQHEDSDDATAMEEEGEEEDDAMLRARHRRYLTCEIDEEEGAFFSSKKGKTVKKF